MGGFLAQETGKEGPGTPQLCHPQRKAASATSFFQGFMSGLLTLAGAATAVAAIVLYVNSLTREPDRFFNIGSMCDSLVPTTESPHGDSYSSWEEDRCRAHMKMVVVRKESPAF